MTITRQITAKNKIFRLKLSAIASRLNELDDLSALKPGEEVEYTELVKAYRGTAMSWIKYRKNCDLPTDMIIVNWLD